MLGARDEGRAMDRTDCCVRICIMDFNKSLTTTRVVLLSLSLLLLLFLDAVWCYDDVGMGWGDNDDGRFAPMPALVMACARMMGVYATTVITVTIVGPGIVHIPMNSGASYCALTGCDVVWCCASSCVVLALTFLLLPCLVLLTTRLGPPHHSLHLISHSHCGGIKLLEGNNGTIFADMNPGYKNGAVRKEE